MTPTRRKSILIGALVGQTDRSFAAEFRGVGAWEQRDSNRETFINNLGRQQASRDVRLENILSVHTTMPERLIFWWFPCSTLVISEAKIPSYLSISVNFAPKIRLGHAKSVSNSSSVETRVEIYWHLQDFCGVEHKND